MRKKKPDEVRGSRVVEVAATKGKMPTTSSASTADYQFDSLSIAPWDKPCAGFLGCGSGLDDRPGARSRWDLQFTVGNALQRMLASRARGWRLGDLWQAD